MPEHACQYLFDTVSLSNFALADSLPLLVQRYGHNLIITTEVLDELIAGVSAGYSRLKTVVDLDYQGVFTSTVMSAEERNTYARCIEQLGSGEASCLAVAASRACVVATDDRAARTACEAHDVRYTGTLGILKASCLDGQLSVQDADDLLATMVRQGFYSPIRRIRDIL